MTALIVEDELFAQAQLSRLLSMNFPDIEVVAKTTSIKETINYLKYNAPTDIIFMDVELSDGEAFEIFRLAPVKAQVIMTTAYNAYAIKAFEAGTIDYLLKPINVNDLQRAVGRCKERLANASIPDMTKLLAALRGENDYKKRLVVRIGDTIIPIEVADIAYFFSEDKANYVVTFAKDKYLIDSTISQLESELDPSTFFRCGRGDIVARSAVKTVARQANGQLQLRLNGVNYSPIVSRSKTDSFLEWLEM